MIAIPSSTPHPALGRQIHASNEEHGQATLPEGSGAAEARVHDNLRSVHITASQEGRGSCQSGGCSICCASDGMLLGRKSWADNLEGVRLSLCSPGSKFQRKVGPAYSRPQAVWYAVWGSYVTL